MKRFVTSSLLACSALLSAPALAQVPPPPPQPTYQPAYQSNYQAAPPAAAMAPTDAPGNGLILNLDLLGGSGSLSVASAGGTGTSTPFLASGAVTSVAVGYYFDQNAIMADVGFAAITGTTIEFQIEPVYRRYMTALHTGTVTPFAEGGLLFAIVSPPAGTSPFGFGLGGAVGAEWLFTKNMGLEGAAELSYLHTNADNVNTDTFALTARAGLVIHI